MEVSDFSLFDGVLVAVSVIAAVSLLRPKVRDSSVWCATVTPLASIIGSGFLVVAPLLVGIAGSAAVFCIVVIVFLSFWLGSAISINIQHATAEDVSQGAFYVTRFERLSETVLAFAYVISIAFYIRLLSSFVLTGVGMFTEFNANVLASLILGFIGGYGYWKGLRGLERLEEYSVSIKLSIIVALLLGLVVFNGQHGYDLDGLQIPTENLWERLRELGGMLLIVQGFETSKYLTTAYEPQLVVRSMRLAQKIAGFIYVVFVALALPLMAPLAMAELDETAIIQMSGEITLALPILLVVAATMSQFSAAIADTIGSGGVVQSGSKGRFSARSVYPYIVAISIALIWTTNIFEVVALASRTFALYYAIQAMLAFRHSTGIQRGWQRNYRLLSYASLSLLLIAIVLFAKPVAA